MTSVKFAWRLAFSRDPRQRWRQVNLVVAAALCASAVVMAVAVMQAAAGSDARIAARAPVWGSADLKPILHMSARGLILPGLGQIPVVWLEPVPGHEGSPALVPPGLKALPGPGEAVLSPGLVRRGIQAEDLGMLPSTVGEGPGGTIGRGGLSTQSEGWVYARPARGRSLGSGGVLLESAGYLEDGDRMSFETLPEVPRYAEAVLGAAWMLLGPAALLLLSAVRASSDVRRARARSLWRLGVGTRSIRLVLALETAFLTLPGAFLGAAAWFVVATRLVRAPLTTADLQRGELRVGLLPSLGCVVAVALTAAFAATVTHVKDQAVRVDARSVRTWHGIPLWIAFLLMAVGPWLPPGSALRTPLLFGGLLLTFVALPMALPVVVARLGAAMGRAGRQSWWLAGRRLRLRSANLSKPAAMVGALVFVAGAAFALYGRLVEVDPPSSSQGFPPGTAFTVTWRDPRPADVDVVARRAGGATVLGLTERDDGRNAVHVGRCDDLRSLSAAMRVDPCDGHGRMASLFADRLSSAMQAVVVIGHPESVSGVLLVSSRQLSEVDVMRMFGGLPAPNVYALGRAQNLENPIAGWMLLGWLLATFLLVVALMREIGDRALTSIGDVRQLVKLNLTPREIGAVHRATLTVPLLVAIPVGWAGAILFALIGYDVGVTISNVLAISAVAGAAACVALATFLGVTAVHRRTQREANAVA